ncbi:MAG: replication initiation protein [Treponema sp.]|nr:replication initiation protein [Treponema sp.]
MIGGKKNIRYTYEVLTALGMKFFPITYHKQNGTSIVGRIHWVDTFFYDEEHDVYAIRISPEIMPLLINLTQNFTSFDIGTAMRLRSKYTQYFAGKNKQGALRGKSPAGRGGEQAQTLFANANQGKAEDNLFVDGY